MANFATGGPRRHRGMGDTAPSAPVSPVCVVPLWGRGLLDSPRRAMSYFARLPPFLESAMSLGTRLFTWLHGTYVGSDSFGNRYYRGRPIGRRKRERRWVIYAGEVEASRVPPEWHGWLHGSQAEPPTKVK